MSGSRAIGGTTLTCTSLAGWPIATAVHFATYRKDGTGAKVNGSQTDWKGIVSGSSINSLTRQGGAADGGSGVGDIVEMMPTYSWANDLAKGLELQHTNAGAHFGINNTNGLTTDTLTVTGASTLTGGTTLPAGDIGTADIAAAAVTDTKLVFGKVRQRQGGSATDWNTVGTSNFDYSGTNTFMQTGTIFNDASPKTITFPVAFTNKPLVMAVVSSVNTTSCFAVVLTITTTTFTCQVYDNAGSTNNSQNINWVAFGQ